MLNIKVSLGYTKNLQMALHTHQYCSRPIRMKVHVGYTKWKIKIPICSQAHSAVFRVKSKGRLSDFCSRVMLGSSRVKGLHHNGSQLDIMYIVLSCLNNWLIIFVVWYIILILTYWSQVSWPLQPQMGIVSTSQCICYILGNDTLHNKLPGVDIYMPRSTPRSTLMLSCCEWSLFWWFWSSSVKYISWLCWAKTRHGNECSSKRKPIQVWDYFAAVDGSQEVSSMCEEKLQYSHGLLAARSITLASSMERHLD